MDYYQQITLLPDPEFPEPLLINALIAKLHRALHDVGEGEVGVSFPNLNKTLGSILRLHGTRGALERLEGSNWCKGMRDHCDISKIDLVPEVKEWCRVKRRQPILSAAKMRRNIKRETYSEMEAEVIWANSKSKALKGPYVQLRSGSSGQNFRLYIEQIRVKNEMVGRFNNYGLSSEATVPWF
jgi:CRISPR-associated endonuclease Csy4